MSVHVFHRIGTEGEFTDPIDKILKCEGEITFDGVYTSVFDHRHLLARKMPILFVTGNQIGRDGFCNREQLLELTRLGFVLGWHGWSHDKLTELSEDRILAELHKPDWISNIYAYPHGEFNDTAKKWLKQLGYTKAYSTTQGDSDVLSIRRTYLS